MPFFALVSLSAGTGLDLFIVTTCTGPGGSRLDPGLLSLDSILLAGLPRSALSVPASSFFALAVETFLSAGGRDDCERDFDANCSLPDRPTVRSSENSSDCMAWAIGLSLRLEDADMVGSC